MKNIHLLPTNKLSRLYLTKEGFYFLLPNIKGNDVKFQNIYITNDEEIKEGDWFLVVGGVGLAINTYHKSNGDTPKNDWLKKIILTTDQDLIKDGIQAIPDEFLNWFVKNPSCEEVEVQKYLSFGGGYQIIIPKEPEPDYTELLQPVGTHICKYCKAETTQSDEECYAKPKQETLEEDGTIIQFLCGSHSYDGVWFGDKHPYREGNFWWRSILKEWQAERMYSEEEVLIILYKHTEDLLVGKKITLEEWFKQFKKK